MNFIDLINHHYKSLTSQDEQIIKYIQQHPDEFLELTSHQLAEKCYVSKTTIFRFLKKCQLNSYAQLKLIVKQQYEIISSPPIDLYHHIQNYHHYIQQIAEQINVTHIVKLIHQASTLYLYGTGNEQKLEVEAIRQLFTSIGKKVIVFFDWGEYVFAKQTFNDNDLLIAISYKGEYLEGIRILQDAKLLNILTLAITRTSQNTMSQLANYRLFVPTTTIALNNHTKHEISTTFYFLIDQLFFEYQRLEI